MDSELPCPACADGGAPGRIGNRRASCPTCNRFAQAVQRRTARQLKQQHPTAYAEIRSQVEREIYASITDRQEQQL